MNTKSGRKILALALCAALGGAPALAVAEDIDIFTGASAASAGNPRILIVLDNTSNWARQSQQWPGGIAQGQAEAHAISTVINGMDGTISVGLMEFVTGGNANDNGGFIRSSIKPMNAANKTAFTTSLTTIYNNINDPDEKRNSNTPYGNLMYDAYNYYAGGNAFSPTAVVAAKADATGYATAYSRFASPLTTDNLCGKNFLIFIGNPNASGPSSDNSTNTAALGALGGLTSQLPLPNFTQQNVSGNTTLGHTTACYANSTAAAAGLAAYATQCATYTEGCSIGAATAVTTPLACASGTHTYSVNRSVYTPASTSSTPGTPVVGTPVTSTGPTTAYYGSSSAVDPNADHGTLTCPAATSVVSGGNTANTTYSCGYSTGAAIGSATAVATTANTNQVGNTDGDGCYVGVGTGAGQWNASTSTDHGGLTCPANNACTYAGAVSGNASGCHGNGASRLVVVTQTATPKRQFTITQTATPTTTNSVATTTPASTVTTTLGSTAACYSSAPASTSDFSSECTGTNISCTYGNAPTSSTTNSCPAGTSVYNVIGANIELTNVASNGGTTDTAPMNADEWARFLHDKGIPVTGSSIKPSVTTYTIDVYNKQPNATHTSLLMSMARAGGGKYFAAKSEQAIIDALKQIVVEIQAVNTAFASTSLPVNATNRSQNENQVFIGMFRPDPDAKPRWFGNLKRYQLVSLGGAIELGDVSGNQAINTLTGFLTPCAVSYWTSDSGAYWSGLGLNPDPVTTCTLSALNAYSDSPDGPQVEKGAVAQILRQGNSPPGTSSAPTFAVNRNMLTLSGGALTSFTTGSSGLDADLVKFIRGEDVNNEKGTGALTTTRPSIHGDVIHSRPLPVNYGGSSGVTVYYGANDGTLRAVEAATGAERWSFVAPEFFPHLSRLKDNSPQVSYPNLSTSIVPTPTPKDYFFDGSTGVYQNADSSKVWLYPSMRRGGRMIYALNASNAAVPLYKWKAGCPNLTDDVGCTTGMTAIGQTWSTPSVAFIKGYSTSTPVVIFGGGYDACEDADNRSPSCGSTKGGVVYILNADTGGVLATFATTRAVAADIAMIDIDGDGMPDYAYAVDTGGSVYRINFIDSPTAKTALTAANWTSRQVAYTTGGYRKFLFSPALLPVQNKVYIAIGSGDREHPLLAQYPYANVTNRFYVYKDDLTAAASTAAQNLDTMENYTNASTCTTPQVLPNSALKGWFMDLNQFGQGEQVVTTALIAAGMVTFSSNLPLPASSASCVSPLGKALGYWVNLFNGSGAIATDGTCGGTRAAEFVGGGLPPSPVMASSVPVDGRAVSVIIGAIQKSGSASVAISPQKIRPTIDSKRRRTYTVTSDR